MPEQERSPFAVAAAIASCGAFLLAFSVGCSSKAQPSFPASSRTLRIGASQIQVQSFTANISNESLAKIAEDGRVTPSVARGWTVSPDGRTISVELRPNVRFHDGELLKAEFVAGAVERNLQRELGPLRDAVESVHPTDEAHVEIKLRWPSLVVLEGLEAQLVNSAGAGTGPFTPSEPAADGRVTMNRNPSYYLGASEIERIQITNYPTVRAAWADMLRGQLDMVYELGTDAREAFESSTRISVFTYTRHYQYLVLLNSTSGPLRSPQVRRALNVAINRTEFIEEALQGYGARSLGPIWPEHWAISNSLPTFQFDPVAASLRTTR
jgi:peptide/nickel transport system substrate-binding protein